MRPATGRRSSDDALSGDKSALRAQHSDLAQLLHLAARRSARDPAEARAFEAGGGAREAQGLALIAALAESKRKAGMKDIARRKRIDRLNRKRRLMAALAALAPERAVGAVSHRGEAAAESSRPFERG